MYILHMNNDCSHPCMTIDTHDYSVKYNNNSDTKYTNPTNSTAIT